MSPTTVGRYDPPVRSDADVFTFDPAAPPPGADGDRRPRLVWAAPGSLFCDEVAEAWARRTATADLGRVSGPWGVVLWDPGTARYAIASDPVGVQPLFCARTAEGLVAVASHLAALVDRPDVDDTVDDEGVLLELLRVFDPEVAHRTPFAAVRRVPWGCALEVDATGTWRPVRYWDPANLPGPDRSLTLDDCAELLHERIDAAVARLLPADGNGVGSHVSSGLDCTTMACRANQLLIERGSTLVAGYSWTPSESLEPRRVHDERDLIDDVVAAEGFPMRFVSDEGAGDWFFGLDPCRYPQSTHVREIHLLPVARADGVTTMLSGWGGDELASFNGRAVMTHLVRTGRWPTVWRQSAARVRVRASGPVRRRQVARAFAGELRSGLRPVHGPLAPRPARLPADLGALAAVSPLAADLAGRRWTPLSTATDHHTYQLALLANGHLQSRCGWWYQTGRLYGIDYRYPLLDLGVVTAALRLPWWAYRSEGWNRLAYRKAVEGWVPASVAWNILKNEPALTAGAQRRRGEAGEERSPDTDGDRSDDRTSGTAGWGGRQRRRPVDDDAYQRLVDLARIDRDLRPGARANLDVILSRPDAAPRSAGGRPV